MASILALIFLIIPAVIGLAILRGWTISILWEWFVVPFGLPVLGIAHAIGIAILVSLLTHPYDAKKDDRETQDATVQIITQAITCLCTLGIGKIVTMYM